MWSLQQLELASELWSYLRDTVDCDRKRLVDFNARKTQLVSFDLSNNTETINVKMDGSAVEEKSSIKMQGLCLSSKLDWGSWIISIAKTASEKIATLIRSSCSVYLRYCYIWKTVVMSVLVLLAATCKC